MGWGDSFWIGTAFGFRPNQTTKDYNIWFSSGIVTEFLVTWNHFFFHFSMPFSQFCSLFTFTELIFFAKRQHKHVLSFGNSLAYWGQNTDRGGGKDKGGKQRQTRFVWFSVFWFSYPSTLSPFSPRPAVLARLRQFGRRLPCYLFILLFHLWKKIRACSSRSGRGTKDKIRLLSGSEHVHIMYQIVRQAINWMNKK